MEQPQPIVIEAKAPNPHDGKTTAIGLVEAGLVAAGTYYFSLGSDGVDYGSPVFWIGMAIAVLRGVHGFYTNRGRSAIVAQPVGQNPTVNVDVKP